MNGAADRGVFSAIGDGIRRVNRAPLVLVGVWAMTVCISLPLAILLRGMLAEHLGSSLAGDSAAAGVDYDWMQEFGEQATGIGATFRPTIVGFGAVLDNLSAFADNVARPSVIVAAATAYIALWLFVAGGIIDRFARDRAIRARGFFSASGVFFLRFLRLAFVQWIAYAFLFGIVHRTLFDRAFPLLTRDVAVERTAFFIRVALYVVFLGAVGVCMLVFDFAKVRAVVEDRRSMIGALGASIGFIRRNIATAAGLFLTNAAIFAMLIGLYGLLAPGAGRAGIVMWLGFGVGQLYILARLWMKLTFWASETALFQARLAHAGYVARPAATWPDSPATEAVRRV